MIVSKRERILIGALGLGACALVADRLFVLRPTTASAQQGAQTNPQTDSAILAAIPHDLLMQHSSDVAQDVPMLPPDIFDSKRLPIAQPVPVAAAATEEDALEITEFRRRYQVRGTFMGTHPVAVIGRQRLKTGDTIGDFKIISIEHDRVVCQNRDGHRETLFVPGRSESEENSHD
ncbi:MAG: hypothetical protein AB7N71_07645 [Phycisphaerae bacterium]